MDYYAKYVQPKEIIKDINFFYNQIKELICNEFFAKYLYNKRKKINVDEFYIENFFSKEERTRLKFINDKIKVKFFVSKTEKGHCNFSGFNYKKEKIEGLFIDIKIVITPKEERIRMIYQENDVLREIRKNINSINEFYVSNFRRSEESKYPIIYEKMKELKPNYYNDWNRLINNIKDFINPDFEENLEKLLIVINGIESNNLDIIYKMIRQTQFYQRYSQQKKIKFNKFIKSLKKECLDDNEILNTSNEIASCFGHKNKSYEESLLFVENLCNHFNLVCYNREMKIINSAFKKLNTREYKETY